MAWTQTDLDAVDQAIASGVLRVTLSDRTIEYRSIDDLKKARTLIIADLTAGTPSAQVRQYRAYTSSGWEG